MDWPFILNVLIGLAIGSVVGFAFGWFAFEMFHKRTLNKHVLELQDIEGRLETIQEKMAAKDVMLTPAEMAEYMSAKRLDKPLLDHRQQKEETTENKPKWYPQEGV